MGYYGGMRKLLLLFAFFLPVPQSSSCCDLNGDGVVNVADVQIEINAAFPGLLVLLAGPMQDGV